MTRQLHGQDTSFLHIEGRHSHMGITMVYFYDQQFAPNGIVRFKDILQHVNSRMGQSPVFKRKLDRLPFDFDYPYWVDDEYFDVEFHARHVALPAPGDWRQLRIQLSRFHIRPLDLARPLWDMCIIEGLNGVEGLPKGSFAIAIKMHHALIDGHTALELTKLLHDDTDAGRDPVDMQQGLLHAAPHFLGKMGRAVYNNVFQPIRAVNALSSTMPKLFPKILHHYQSALADTEAKVPTTRFQNKVSFHRVWNMFSCDLDDLQKIKRMVPNAKLNDVVLAIVAGALRAYLLSKGELPKQPVRVLAPINTRSENENNSAGNQVAFFFAELPTVEIDALKRLALVVRSTRDSKRQIEEIGARAISDVHKYMPPIILSLTNNVIGAFGGLGNILSTAGNTVVSNVPGPTGQMYLLGAKLVNCSAIAPIADGVGLVHGVNSYNGKLNVSVTACREMMPDPEFYVDCLKQSFQDLLHAISHENEKHSAENGINHPKIERLSFAKECST